MTTKLKRQTRFPRTPAVPVLLGTLLLAGGLQAGPLWNNGAVTPNWSNNKCDDGPNTCGATRGASWTLFDNFTVGPIGWVVSNVDISDFFFNTPLGNYQSTRWAFWSGDPLSGGTLVASGNTAGVLGTPNCNTGSPSACLVKITVPTPSLFLPAGNYYLGTSNVMSTIWDLTARAFAAGNGLAGWEQSNGSAVGSTWTKGGIDSRFSATDTAFDINGTLAPEPGTFALMAIFLLAGGGLIRSRRVG